MNDQMNEERKRSLTDLERRAKIAHLMWVLDQVLAEGMADAFIWAALVVVGGKSDVHFMCGYDPHRRACLARAVELGGEPVGLVAISQNHDMHTRPIEEYDDEQWAKKYLGHLVESQRQRICELAVDDLRAAAERAREHAVALQAETDQLVRQGKLDFVPGTKLTT
jgi:hypothetical protein